MMAVSFFVKNPFCFVVFLIEKWYQFFNVVITLHSGSLDYPQPESHINQVQPHMEAAAAAIVLATVMEA